MTVKQKIGKSPLDELIIKLLDPDSQQRCSMTNFVKEIQIITNNQINSTCIEKFNGEISAPASSEQTHYIF